MINKRVKLVIVFILIALFVLPFSVTAQVQNSYEQIPKFSDEELTQMLAPIALYPDALLSQIMIAASYPFEIAEADRWLSRNPYLTDEQLDNALQGKDWDVSVLSLCHYPKVLSMMAENLKWTAKLGDAFVYQQEDVMNMIQELRARASAQGNLTTTNEQKVIVEERIIRIEPGYYNYFYVPVYDPLVVYGPWWYPAFPPFRIFYPGVAVIGPRIVFSPRLFIGFGVIGWSFFDWRAHHVVIMNIDRTRHFNRHYHIYHYPHKNVYWKPDHKKRMVHKYSVTRSPSSHYIKKSPQSVPKSSRSKKGSVVAPPKTKTRTLISPPVIKKKQGPAKPNVINKNKHTVLTPKNKSSDVKPKVIGPRIDKNKTKVRTKTVSPKTPVSNKNRQQPQIQPKSKTVKPSVNKTLQRTVKDSTKSSANGKQDNIINRHGSSRHNVHR